MGNPSSLVSSFCWQLWLLILLTSEMSFFFPLFLLESCSGAHPLMSGSFPSVSSPNIFMGVLYLFFFSRLLDLTAPVVSPRRVPTGSSSFNLARGKKSATLCSEKRMYFKLRPFSPPSPCRAPSARLAASPALRLRWVSGLAQG